MLPVSKEFHAAMVADNRRTFGRVTIDYTGPFVDQNITASANEQANAAALLTQVADGVTDPVRRWASCDGSTLADGNSFPAPATTADGQMGWWGTQMAGAGGAFVIPFPTLTVAFASRPIHSLRVVGDLRRNEWPVDFEIRLLGIGGIVRHTHTVTGNTLMDWQVTITPVTEVTQYVLEVRRWSHAGRQAKVPEVLTSIQETYEGGDIISVGLLEERELAHDSLPVGIVSANEITIRLDNSTRRFDAGNRESPLYQLLRQNRRIRAWLGVLPEKATTETTQADWAAGTLHSVRATGAGDLVLDEAVRTAFARESVAYSQNGALVDALVPRYGQGRFGQAVMVEEGTTNLLNAVSSKAEANMLSNDSAFATLVYVSNFGRSDNTSAVSTQIAAGGVSMGFYFNTAGFAPVIAGLVYTASCYVYTNHIGRSYTIRAGWLRADNSTMASPSATFSLTAGEWTRLVITGTAPVDAVNLRIVVTGSGVAAVGEQYWFDDICVEQKPYATSWQIGGTPRAAESLTIPSAGVLSPTEGTIEFWANLGIGPMSMLVRNFNGVDHNNALGIMGTDLGSGNQNMHARIGTGAGFVQTPNIPAPRNAWHYFACRWTASGLWFTVNSTTTTVARSAVGVFDPVTWIGSNVGSVQANSLIDDLRISNRARTDTEIAAAFASGQPLPVNANTTYLLRGDGSLLNAVHLPSGSRISPPIDLSFLTDTVSATASWGATVPTETMLDVETSLDNGATWHPIANGGNIAGIAGGQNMSGVSLLARQVLTTQNAGLTPQLQDLTIMQVNREYVPLGTFWSGEWTAQREKLYASTTGRDRLEFLRKSTYSASQVFVNESLHALATTILTNAGLTASEYWVDPALQSIIVPNAWFDTVSHREALRQIAEASLGQVYCDRSGIIRVEGAGHLLGQESFVGPMMSSAQSLTISADDYFRKDTPVKWGEMANRIEVETQPLRTVAVAQEVFRSNEPVPIAAGQTLTLTVRYNEPPVIEAAASILSSWIWRDTFDTDQISTHYTSGGDVLATWAVSGGVLSATGGSQAILLRNGLTIADGEIVANVDQASNGGLIARYVDNNNYYLLALSDDSGANPLNNLRMLHRINGIFTELAVGTVVWPRGTPAQIRFRFNGSLLEAWFNGELIIAATDTNFTSGGVGMRQSHAEVTRFLDFVVPLPTTITATIFYAWGADVTVNSTNAGAFTLVINGRPMRILNKERAVAEDAASMRDHGLLRYEYPANHLVQTLAQAQTIADTLLRLYRHPRRDLAMDWRGNPAMTLGDMIITRDHQDWLRYWITKQEIDYDGALRARLEGRLAR